MAPLPTPDRDPTLEAADAALEAIENRKPARDYVGMSGIGGECERRIWNDWRWVTRAKFNAETLKRFADGHAGEDVQIARLRMVPGVTLLNIDPDTGRQFGFTDLDGHFRGHMDGAIIGLLQAPKTWHVYEHKQVGEKKQAKLAKLKAEKGEKQALAEWDSTYYGQAILYMHYSGMTRHYLTCSTPGGRSTISVRTDENPEGAMRLIERARRIIGSAQPPARISTDPAWYVCRFCDHASACHGEAMPERHCRSCLHSTPVDGGSWHCARHDWTLTQDQQRVGCAAHLMIPALVPGEQVDAGDDWVSYQMRDGSEWRDGVPA
jgi:hypothetical protein